MAAYFKVIAEGAALGFATGPYCAAACGPALLPWLLAFSEAGTARITALFLGGRLAAYAAAALAASFSGGYLEKAAGPQTAAFVSIASGAYMLAAFFVFRWQCRSGCERAAALRAGPLALGFMTGIAPCPPLAGAVIKAAGLPGPAALLMFGGFFAASSLFVLPAAALQPFLRSERAANIGRLTLAAMSVYLICAGLLKLL
ncbi:MAG: sulfite exporter TauE/SafE family protein [Elusimicrobiales bacterium]